MLYSVLNLGYLSLSDVQQLRDIIFVLASQGWQKAVEENSLDSVDRLVQHFCTLLEAAGAGVEKSMESSKSYFGMLQPITIHISLYA